MKFTKCFYKIVFGWQNRGAQYKNHHHLSTVITGAYQHMAKQSVSGVLIIGLYLKWFQKSANIADDRICSLIFNQTFINGYDKMRSLLVCSWNHGTVLSMTEYSMYFVSVMEWVLHSDNLLCLTVWLKKLAHMILFLFQLFLIRHVQELTSTAFSMYRTEWFFCFLWCHFFLLRFFICYLLLLFHWFFISFLFRICIVFYLLFFSIKLSFLSKFLR